MKKDISKVVIFDFDGVFLSDPNDFLFSFLENNVVDPVLKETIFTHGSFPDHLHETEVGKKLYEKFSLQYFGQKIPEEEIERIKGFIGRNESMILSYNKKSTIEKLLDNSGISNLFDGIVASSDEGVRFPKKDFFELIKFSSDKEIVFFTDSVSDMVEAINYVDSEFLYGVTHSKDHAEKLRQFTSNIIKPFFKPLP